mmetsp:Transcript_88851/g.153893  ORF Transcript_88851/g.153893 Transcript_88851/m.153893 type:complete len:333 (-) Transcript_88851:219-1217(-)
MRLTISATLPSPPGAVPDAAAPPAGMVPRLPGVAAPCGLPEPGRHGAAMPGALAADPALGAVPPPPSGAKRAEERHAPEVSAASTRGDGVSRGPGSHTCEGSAKAAGATSCREGLPHGKRVSGRRGAVVEVTGAATVLGIPGRRCCSGRFSLATEPAMPRPGGSFGIGPKQEPLLCELCCGCEARQGEATGAQPAEGPLVMLAPGPGLQALAVLVFLVGDSLVSSEPPRGRVPACSCGAHFAAAPPSIGFRIIPASTESSPSDSLSCGTSCCLVGCSRASAWFLPRSRSCNCRSGASKMDESLSCSGCLGGDGTVHALPLVKTPCNGSWTAS